MKKIEFFKLQASGNDFILVDRRKFLKNKNKKALSTFVKKCCLRKKGIGADGMLFIEPSVSNDFRMRIFNVDGSEAQMCGNGARCAAFWSFIFKAKNKKRVCFDTQAGLVEAFCKTKVKKGKLFFSSKIKTKTTNPFDLKRDLTLRVLGRKIKVDFINTGVPHAVIFVDGLALLDVEKIGRAVRFAKKFQPQGTNVNFVQVKRENELEVRTYERGVENETLACGTGSIAAAVIYFLKVKAEQKKSYKVKVKTKGGETLTVTFSSQGKKIKDTWLEGKAFLTYGGKMPAGT